MHCSTIASNNAQVRCNFVDLYYSLFGSKVPNCLAKNEQPLTSGLPRIPKIPKISENKRSASPFETNGTSSKQPIVEAPVDRQEPPIVNRESDSVSRPVEIKEEPTETIKVINTRTKKNDYF